MSARNIFTLIKKQINAYGKSNLKVITNFSIKQDGSKNTNCKSLCASGIYTKRIRTWIVKRNPAPYMRKRYTKYVKNMDITIKGV